MDILLGDLVLTGITAVVGLCSIIFGTHALGLGHNFKGLTFSIVSHIFFGFAALHYYGNGDLLTTMEIVRYISIGFIVALPYGGVVYCVFLLVVSPFIMIGEMLREGASNFVDYLFE